MMFANFKSFEEMWGVFNFLFLNLNLKDNLNKKIVSFKVPLWANYLPIF